MGWLARISACFQRRKPPESFGEQGERAVAKYLRRRGYKIVAQRERGRMGELDIVAVHGGTVVFVEVKTRRSHEAGHPTESITTDKQRRLTRSALAFLKRHDLLERKARFDVVAVTWPEHARRPAIEHYEDAFEAVGAGQMFN
jgi:putative endonuclease